jgi:Mce-associated membrane protein
MSSPRERPRAARRRIAGERVRRSERAETERPEETPLADTAATTTVPQERVEPPPSDPAATDEPAETAPAPEPQAGPEDDSAGPPRWALAVLAALVVVALALDGFVVWREVDQRQDRQAAARALDAALIRAPSVAEQAAEAVLSFRHDTIEQDVAQARRFLTDDYAPAYIRSIRDVVADPAGQVRATVEAQVLSSGVVEAGRGRSDVLLFVNQVTRSPAEEPQTALNRVVFTMVPRDGRWQVDEIKAF